MGGNRQNPAVRLAYEAVYQLLRGITRVVAALPARWVLTAGDVVGTALYWLDHRGRRAGRQNLQVVYRDRLTNREKRRIQIASMRGIARALAVVCHAAPLTPARFRAWVDVPEDVEQKLRDPKLGERGAVIVSAHVGNWEILLGLAALFPEHRIRFLAEDLFHPIADRFLAYLRGQGGGRTARRKGGALALQSHLKAGGVVGIVIDENVRRVSGGIWAPFFGLEARTTPLPAWLARKYDVPIAPLFCVPQPDGRYRVTLAPEVSMDVRTDDLDADVKEITARLNRVVEDVIRAHPDSWSWLLKRFKSRPTETLGAYPAYSLYDP